MPITPPLIEQNGSHVKTATVVPEDFALSLPSENRSTAVRQIAQAIRLLLREKAFIIFWTTVCVSIAVVVALLLPKRYESTTRLLPSADSSGDLLQSSIQKMKPELGALAGLTGMPSLSNGKVRFVALLRSTAIADRIIKRFDLKTVYHARYHQEVREALADHTVIEEDRKTDVISITVSDTEPTRAADMAKAYTEELQKFNAEMNNSAAHMERVFLEARSKQVAKELETATAQLSGFATTSRMLDPQEQPKGLIAQAARLESSIIELKAEINGAEQIFTPEALKSQHAQLAELERKFAAIRGSSSSSQPDSDDGFPSILSLPKLGAAYVDYFRRVKLLEGVQMYLSQRLELAKVDEVKQLPAFSVMDPPDVPELRVWPKRGLIVIAAFFLSLLASCAFVYIRSQWREAGPGHPLWEFAAGIWPSRFAKF